jgi:Holliday junction resolvase RusA-like endonuclease
MESPIYRFWIPGEPEGKKSVVTFIDQDTGKRRGANPTRKYMRLCAAYALANMPMAKVFDCPILFELLIVMERPKRLLPKDWPRCAPLDQCPEYESDLWCDEKPDGSNVRKGVEDAMKLHWKDDCRVVTGDTRKIWAEAGWEPGVLVTFQPLGKHCPHELIEAVRTYSDPKFRRHNR